MKRIHSDTDELATAKIDSIINMFDKLLSIEDPEKNTENTENTEMNTEMNTIIGSINSEIFKVDPELEWKKLNDNITKLNYFKNVFSKINKFNRIYFEKAFSKFMDKIDEVNQYYLRVISFNLEDYTNTVGFTIYDADTLKEMVVLISSSIDKSLNCNNLYTKLDHVLAAYSNLVLLAEDVRETYYSSDTKKIKLR
jgi:hypothetical protein